MPFFYDWYYLTILYRHFHFKKYFLFSASESFDSTYPTNVVVTSEGLCTYIPPGMFKSSCPIDITWFPFDDQSCEMKFGSWTYNGFKVKKHFFIGFCPGSCVENKFSNLIFTFQCIHNFIKECNSHWTTQTVLFFTKIGLITGGTL